MKVKELLNELKKFSPEATIYVASDEELNTIFKGFEVAELESPSQVVIYGLSGQEKEDY